MPKPIQMEVWKKQIVLNWDGEWTGVPELDQNNKYTGRLLAFEPIHMAKPIGDRAELVQSKWEHVGKHARWSKAYGKFFMSLSAQNLFRIYRQFGKIDVVSGQRHIDALKVIRKSFLEICAEAERIKNASVPEAFDFKLPPLAPYQHRGVELSVHVPLVPLLFDCGLGKTYISLVSSEIQIKRGMLKRGKILVAGKLLTLVNGWMDDCRKFTDLKPELLWLKPTTKRKEKMIKILQESDADIFITNHETIKILKKELAEHKFERIILDEATILKNFRGADKKAGGSDFGRHLMEISGHAKYKAVLTGTPAPNSPADLWGLFHWLDPDGFLLEPHYRDFQHAYMKEVIFGRSKEAEGVEGEEGYKPKEREKKTWVVLRSKYEEIAQLHQQLSYRARLRDHLKDLPPLTVAKRSVEMGKEQALHYKEMLDRLATEIEDEFISVPVMLAQMNKLRQISGGFIIDQMEQPHEILDGCKLLACDLLVHDEIAEDEKIIIACQYQWEVQTLAKRYAEYNPVTIYGKNNGAKNLENVDRFINDPSVRIVVLNPASAAHGITFVHSRYMIVYSMDFSAERDYQLVKRIERAGQKRAMFLYYLIAEKPPAMKLRKAVVDQLMWTTLERKHFDQELVIDNKTFEKNLLTAWKSHG